MKKHLRHSLLALTLMLSTNISLVGAQGTITEAPATFVLNASQFDASPSANFTGVSPTLSQDHLFETGWWFRVSGGAAETFFPVPITQNYTGDTATLDWTSLGGALFSAQLKWVVNNDATVTGFPSGTVRGEMTITNLSAVNPLTLSLFNMADFDVQPTAGNDTAVLGPTGGIDISDAGTNIARYRGIGADAYLVRAFDGASVTDVAGVLSDAAVNNFDNTGLPFGPGDFTGGWQWKDRTIPASGTLKVEVVLTVNYCTYAMSPVNQVVVSGGGAMVVNMVTPATCPWTVTSNAPSWVTITGASSGTGNGPINYTVAPNPGPNPRRGTMTVTNALEAAPQATFIVSQQTPLPPPCTITVTPTTIPLPLAGGTGNLTITASSPSCQWRL
ncbi:MAG: BACON domain-containing protein, partial [Deltaproteobacteria bacterium]|nr:BACON domain-containing protein [Deltaproteobacteria bacterium]